MAVGRSAWESSSIAGGGPEEVVTLTLAVPVLVLLEALELLDEPEEPQPARTVAARMVGSSARRGRITY